MSNERQIIDDYLERVGRHLTGPARDRAKAEVGEHLSDAAEAGELTEALSRLGAPHEAAATFAELRSAPPAPMDARLTAVVIDNLPLAGVTIALLVQGIVGTVERSGFALAFPPFVYAKIGDGCVAIGPPPQCGAYDDAGLLYSLGVPLALLWSIAGLGLLEAWTGTTPGKRLMKLCVVTEAGLRIHPVAGVVRRLSLLLGPLAWLDWLPVVWGDRRRVLDRLTEVKVVSVREAK
ncbi:RDD family protein [Nonomuraea sp. K274]|uniref:RDD family protein n=1 Tax=Nonomuraea cypriaca TaxID=1187855 RepID=A0A931A265_9ACTN|nr:RDD family protein [Nonomuraea cypriaca]MBF8184841.1 RDD family protein [Nonomuraea cypriaca]